VDERIRRSIAVYTAKTQVQRFLKACKRTPRAASTSSCRTTGSHPNPSLGLKLVGGEPEEQRGGGSSLATAASE
jgi:hypothetical protein